MHSPHKFRESLFLTPDHQDHGEREFFDGEPVKKSRFSEDNFGGRQDQGRRQGSQLVHEHGIKEATFQVDGQYGSLEAAAFPTEELEGENAKLRVYGSRRSRIALCRTPSSPRVTLPFRVAQPRYHETRERGRPPPLIGRSFRSRTSSP
jgi:hypothetical protein